MTDMASNSLHAWTVQKGSGGVPMAHCACGWVGGEGEAPFHPQQAELKLVQAKCERLRNEVRELRQAVSLAENAKLRVERDCYRKALSNIHHRLSVSGGSQTVDRETLWSIVDTALSMPDRREGSK